MNFRQYRSGVFRQTFIAVCRYPAHTEYQGFDFRLVKHQRRQAKIGMQYKSQARFAADVRPLCT